MTANKMALDALTAATDALEEIALAGMSGTGQESKEGMTEWHASRAWEFIGIASRAAEKARAAIAALQAEPQGWMPIETAPEKTLVICMWLDDEDTEHPERYAFDLFDDGLWQNYFNEHEHYLIAGAAKGRSEEAPYTHWTPIPATPLKD